MPAASTFPREQDSIVARALEFTILTAARSGEVRGAKQSEINFVDATWTIPAERMNTRRGHHVPLSKEALALLQALPREHDNEFVFIGARHCEGISRVVMPWFLGKTMGLKDVTVHGFRSKFRDWAGETTSYPHDTHSRRSLGRGSCRRRSSRKKNWKHKGSTAMKKKYPPYRHDESSRERCDRRLTMKAS
jgi:integrase